MNKKFCDSCNNLLYSITTPDSLYFVCGSCYEEYKSSNNDSLRFKSEKKTNFELYDKIIRNLKFDPAAIIIKKKCEKCKHPLAKKARLGKNKKVIYACIGKECSNIWSN